MNYKKQSILNQLIIVAMLAMLSGCGLLQEKPEPANKKTISQKSKPDKKKSIAQPRRVIHGGLGLSFDITHEQAGEMGFVEASSCEFKKISSDDPFWFLKTIHFTNLSCTVVSFRAVRYYKDEDVFTREALCDEDKNLILEILKEKYPTLVPVIYQPDATRLCEGMDDSSRGQLPEKGLGRCITLNCKDSEVIQASGLTVEYTDLDNMRLGITERKEAILNNRGSILENKNLDPSQF